jgi:uncharacterized membrane protein YphA (DoxX/SURF4 family)
MNDSMAQARPGLTAMELPGWKTALSWTASVLLALLFLVSGLWKITDAQGWAVRVAQAHIPQALSLPAALLVGIAETVGGVLVLVPRFRRWGALLIGFLLVVFLAYFAINYSALRGADCSCFPWLKRVVGPGFFISDAAMLLGALVAGIWSKPSSSLRTAFLILGAVSVFAVVSYGVAAARQTGTRAPDAITVDGKPFSLQQGRIFIYYFDPECMHCFDAAKRMSRMNWGDTKVVAVPIQNPQFAPQFLQDTGLKAAVSPDVAVLRQVFPFVSAPAGVALENGRERAPLTQFEGDEPGATLKKLGFVY